MTDDSPKCPKCGCNRHVYEEGDRDWWCDLCKIAFDPDPDEGGDFSTDPARRAEREEGMGFRVKFDKRPRVEVYPGRQLPRRKNRHQKG